MKYSFNRFFSLLAFVLIAYGVVSAGLLVDDADAQSCNLLICKSAEDSEGVLFPFNQETNQGPDLFELTGVGDQGSCREISIPLNETNFVIELPIQGWALDDIICELIGVEFVVVENSVGIHCLTPSASGGCTFFNVRGESVTNIPTLSEWGMIAAAAGLAVIGVFFAVRRRRATA